MRDGIILPLRRRRAVTFGFLSGLRWFAKSCAGFPKDFSNVSGGPNGPSAKYNPMLIKCAPASRN